MKKKKTVQQLQKLYDELGVVLVNTPIQFKETVFHDFCENHGLELTKARRNLSKKKLLESLPQLPFKE